MNGQSLHITALSGDLIDLIPLLGFMFPIWDDYLVLLFLVKVSNLLLLIHAQVVTSLYISQRKTPPPYLLAIYSTIVLVSESIYSGCLGGSRS